jgi:Putative Sin3 binding protein
MSATVGKPISNIAVAFAGKSASLNIPQPPPSGRAAMLPTPPNSISPTLPPHKGRSPSLHGAGASNQIDSDIDLQDAVEHAQAQGHPQALSSAALSGLEAAGAITPSMLAKHHLPDILLANGPIAIRHVLGHLTQTVPGFSRIPPAKARRIVVSALEGRAGGGVNGDVLFEKVGWGRWDARLKGQPPRECRGGQPMRGVSQEGSHAVLSPPASYSGSYALSSAGFQIPNSFQPRDGRRDYSGASWAGESILSSRDEEMEDMNMAEHEADKMSLDGRDDSGVSSMAPEDPMDVPISNDPDDETDEEDWARIGPEALSKGTVPRASARGGRRPSRNYNYLSLPSKTVRMKPTPSLMKAVPSGQRHHSFLANQQLQRGGRASAGGVGGTAQSFSSCGFSLGIAQMQGVQDAQEREAVEALLRMGSM